VNDLAILAIPATAVAGVVLVALGFGGAGGRARPERAGRAQRWLAQAGVRGARPWHLAALCLALGPPPGWSCSP
jgi:hypothetical protein